MSRPSTRVRVLLTGLTIGTLVLAADVFAMPQERGVHYVEHPIEGDSEASGRRLTTTGGAFYGIDFNSSVDIVIDEAALAAALGVGDGDPVIEKLADHAEQLRKASAGLQDAMTKTEAMFEAWSFEGNGLMGQAEGGVGQRVADFRAKANEQAVAMLQILSAAQQAQRIRAEIGGPPPRFTTDDALDQPTSLVFSEKVGVEALTLQAYNWSVLRRVLAGEIEFFNDELLRRASDVGLKLELQAHILGPSGTARPVFLPGHNQVRTGPNVVLARVTFSISEQEKKLFEEAQQTASNLDDADSIAQALLQSLEADFVRIRPDLERTLGAAHDAYTVIRQRVSALGRWRDGSEWEAWIAETLGTLPREELAPVVEQLEVVRSRVIVESREDLEALRQLGGFREQLASQSPAAAMASLLSVLETVGGGDSSAPGFRALSVKTWEERLGAITELQSRVQSLPQDAWRSVLLAAGGPIAAVIDTVTAFEAAIEDLHRAVPEALRTLSNRAATYLGPIAVARDLPRPTGQRRLGIEPGRQLDTSLNLRTIVGGRQPGEEVRLQYRFFHGDTEVAEAGWEDRFRLRVFGWHDTVAAGIAYTRQLGTDGSGDGRWRPTATLSWILDRDAWPGDHDRGLGDLQGIEWFSGIGLTTMFLDFSPDQGTELGVAGTLSFLSNRLLIGAGRNLAVGEDPWFTFFSLRIFDSGGLISPQRTGGGQ